MKVTEFLTPIGKLWLFGEGDCLFEISFKKREGEREDNLPIFIETKKLLNAYFKGEKVDFSHLKLSYFVSPFREEVWSILKTIPYGKTMTYGDIAKIFEKKYNKKMSAQAVGMAVGRNLFPIIIPCHRILGKGGELTGYSGGIDKKIILLKIEKVL